MKLTQKTIFQCFDKSRPQSIELSDDKDEDVIICEPEIKSNNEQKHSNQKQPDFLIPVHIHQRSKSPSNDVMLNLNQWKLTETSENETQHYTNKFSRICSIHCSTNRNSIKTQHSKFVCISSIERQMELFQQYINDDLNSYSQSTIDWHTMFQCLQDYRKTVIEQNQYDQLPWTEIYRPKCSKAYLGNHTKQFQRINQWFLYWKKKLHNERPKQNLRKGRKRVRETDENSDEDFIDESNTIYYNRCQSKREYPQLLFIHGYGTTSLVHALAEQHSFKVTEINASQSRARSSLLKQLEQVTSHHHLSLKRCSSDTLIQKNEKSTRSAELHVKKKVKNERGTIMSFFNTENTEERKQNKSLSRTKSKKLSTSKTIKQTRKNEDSNGTQNQFISSVQVEKTSLIFFDEIETVTIDDHFWSCLKKILETAKKPIILTSSSRTNPDDIITNLSKIGDYEMLHLEPNEPALIYCFLRLILLTEMLEMASFDDLISIFQSCSCDLRQSLLTLEFLVRSSTVSTCNSTTITLDKHVFTPHLQSTRIFDAMSYSYLRDQWDLSILKTLFDDLTKTYTSDYEQSHILLTNQYKNDPKRIELYNTLNMFIKGQEIESLSNDSSLYLDYRPYIRRICQNEQIRAAESTSNRRFRHCLGFRGCSLQWSDFAILSGGLN